VKSKFNLHDINQFLDFLHIFRDFTSGNGTDYVVGSRVLEPYAEFARAIFCFEFAFRLCEKPPFGLVAFYVGYKQVAYQIYNIPSPLRKLLGVSDGFVMIRPLCSSF